MIGLQVLLNSLPTVMIGRESLLCYCCPRPAVAVDVGFLDGQLLCCFAADVSGVMTRRVSKKKTLRKEKDNSVRYPADTAMTAAGKAFTTHKVLTDSLCLCGQ